MDMLSLIHLLKANFISVEQPKCADDAGAGGIVSEIRGIFRKLQEIGPSYELFPVLQHIRPERIPRL